MNNTPPAVVAAILADYAAGMSSTAAARKHGVSPATAHRHIHAAGISRSLRDVQAKARERREAEHALTGGRWVPGRHGVQVWEAS